MDDAFGQLDVARAGDLRIFLAAQLTAIEALDVLPGADRAEAEAEAGAMRAALARDLHALGMADRPVLAKLCVGGTAVLYVLRGSRMGTQILARRWRTAADARARGAGRYLTQNPGKDRWRALCAALAARPAQGDAADAIVAQTGLIFDLYAAALAAIVAPASRGPVHA